MKISNYFAKEKMDDTVFVQTYIQRLSELQESDIVWTKSNLDEDNEAVQSLLMEMVLSFLCDRFSGYERLWRLFDNSTIGIYVIEGIAGAFNSFVSWRSSSSR